MRAIYPKGSESSKKVFSDFVLKGTIFLRLMVKPARDKKCTVQGDK